MINVNALQQGKSVTSPFKYALINKLLPLEACKNLVKELPKENNFLSVRNIGSDKTYKVVNNILLRLEDNKYDDKAKHPPKWKTLVKALVNTDYTSALGSLLQEDLSDCSQEITFKQYGRGNYMSPHTDRSEVKATHLIFLNSYWEKAWGGQLCFLDPQHKILKIIQPLWYNSIAFVRSENSWHCVKPCQIDNPSRLAVQVVFWNTRKRDVAPGRNKISV